MSAEKTTYELSKILRDLEKRIDKAQCCCESLTGKNLGLGHKLFYSKNKNYLQFRTLIAGSNITITTDANNETITINSTGGGTSFTCTDLLSCSTSSLPEGTNLYYTDARVLSYMTGKNISIFTNDSGFITSAALAPYLTIASAAATYEPIITPGVPTDYWSGNKTWQPFPSIPTGTVTSFSFTNDTTFTGVVINSTTTPNLTLTLLLVDGGTW